jgi:hypothetical protein
MLLHSLMVPDTGKKEGGFCNYDCYQEPLINMRHDEKGLHADPCSSKHFVLTSQHSLPRGITAHGTFKMATLRQNKAGDTLSSRHVSSRDVTSAVWIFNIEFWRTLTLLSFCLRHVIWRGALVGSHTSTPLKFLLAHTFRRTWRTSDEICQITWRKQSDRSVIVRQNSVLNIPTALVTSREFTWREDSVSPA